MNIDLRVGNCLEILPQLAGKSVHCCVTSPPYWGLRDYGCRGQLGLEATPDEYVNSMVEVFRAVWRVLRDDGTLWLNLGDTFFGGGRGGNPEESAFRKQATNQGSLITPPKWQHPTLKPKDLIGIPWRVAFALQADGWYLRSEIIWAKPNPMPESVTDRPTKAHEQIFLLAKSPRYFYDAEAVLEDSVGRGSQNMEPTTHRNRRSVWTVSTKPYRGAHFATFPPKLIEPCILAGCPEGGTVLDPFAGSGTTGAVCRDLARNFIGIELSEDYAGLARQRIAAVNPVLF